MLSWHDNEIGRKCPGDESVPSLLMGASSSQPTQVRGKMKNCENRGAQAIDLPERFRDVESGDTWQIRPLTVRENALRMLLTSRAYLSANAAD
jgi:hypothetical protein